MPSIPGSEAKFLLARPLLCTGAGEWKRLPGRNRIWHTSAGLIDELGCSTSLVVDLRFRDDPGSRGKTYQFSVLNRNRYGSDRVYQLEVRQTKGMPKNPHERPHEHIGTQRVNGPDDWDEWAYDELLRYFCTRTNVTFEPAPADPARFRWGKR